jgi:hypothetical protein
VGYLVAEELIRRGLFGEIPEEDDVVHACGGHVLAGGVQVETHDGFLMPLQRSDEAGVLFVELHF